MPRTSPTVTSPCKSGNRRTCQRPDTLVDGGAGAFVLARDREGSYDLGMERTSAGRFRRRGAVITSPAPEVAPALEPLEPVVEHEPLVPLATPEPAFAARVPPPAPVAPPPASRRAIFFDVENTSSAGHIARVI